MAGGGLIGSTYHNWGKGYKDGGHVKKKANGGLAPGGLGAAGVPPRKPFTPGAVPGQRPGTPGARPPVVPLTGGRPTRPGYMKKGGSAEHEDEAEDKKLIAKMMKAKKYQDGGGVSYSPSDNEEDTLPQASSTSVPAASSVSGSGSKSGVQGVLDAVGKVGKVLGPKPTNANAAAGAQNAGAQAMKEAQDASSASMKALRNVNRSATGFKPAAIPGGGTTNFKFKAGGATGKGRLAKIPAARAVPAKTEI
jgi:hypothetical protein